MSCSHSSQAIDDHHDQPLFHSLDASLDVWGPLGFYRRADGIRDPMPTLYGDNILSDTILSVIFFESMAEKESRDELAQGRSDSEESS